MYFGMLSSHSLNQGVYFIKKPLSIPLCNVEHAGICSNYSLVSVSKILQSFILLSKLVSCGIETVP